MAEKKTEKKKARRGLAELNPADREMAVMRRCRANMATLDTPEARIRVVNWLSAVAHSDATAPKPPPVPAAQLTLDDPAGGPFP